MKFSKTLKQKQVQEWRTKYLGYEDLKSRIEDTEEEFIRELFKEVEKVELFCKVLERGILRGLADLLEMFPKDEFPSAYEIVYANWRQVMGKSVGAWYKRTRHERTKKPVTRKSRENKILELYMAINKVVQYKKMNLTGCRKILKKYDKFNGTKIQEKRMEEIHNRPVFKEKTIEEIMKFIRYIHKEITPHRKRDKAKRLVLDLTEEDAEGDGKSFSAGAMMATSLFLMILSIKSKFSIYYSILYTFDVLLFVFGILFYVCRKNLVNYSLILELNLKPKIKISRYFLMSTILLFVHSVAGYLNINGIAMVVTTCIVWVMPLEYFFKGIRFYFVRTVSEIFAYSILGKIHFKHFFIADYLLSFRSVLILAVSVLIGNARSSFALISITHIPVAIRILQCLRRYFENTSARRHAFPHLYNTLKYLICLFSDTLLILSENNVGVWIGGVVMAIISNIFGLGWDVYVDWMLWDRPKVYSNRLYIVSCIFNGCVRSMSVSVLIVLYTIKTVSTETKISIKLFLCIVEIVRRVLWGIIRIEVEHLNNCNKLKAISGPLNDLFYLEDDSLPE